MTRRIRTEGGALGATIDILHKPVESPSWSMYSASSLENCLCKEIIAKSEQPPLLVEFSVLHYFMAFIEISSSST